MNTLKIKSIFISFLMCLFIFTPITLYAEVAEGFEEIDSSVGVTLYKYDPIGIGEHYVLELDLQKGAFPLLMTAKIDTSDPYTCSPRISIDPIEKYWEAINQQSNAFAVLNGAHFNVDGALMKPLKINTNKFCLHGTDNASNQCSTIRITGPSMHYKDYSNCQTYGENDARCWKNGDFRKIEIWDSGKALISTYHHLNEDGSQNYIKECAPENTENGEKYEVFCCHTYHDLDDSDAQQLLVGFRPFRADKSDTKDGRTLIGAKTSLADDTYSNLVILVTNSMTEAEAVNVLHDFGVDNVNDEYGYPANIIVLDGGGSSQLYDHSGLRISQYYQRDISQAIGIFQGNKAYINLLWPDQPERIRGGNTYQIKWNYIGTGLENTEVKTVSIKLSTNVYEDYDTIATDIPVGKGVYEWKVPKINADYCYIHILGESHLGPVSDTTLFNFSIAYDLIQSDFNANILKGDAPLTIEFNDQSTAKETAITTWKWDFNGDGIFDAFEQNPSHTYTTPGLHSVSLYVSDGLFDDILTKHQYIWIYDDLPENTIIAMEYFFDNDPGLGKGIIIPVMPENAVSETININLNHLNTGLHRLYVRALDDRGDWSIALSKTVLVQDSHKDDPLPDIQTVEYFFDTDPGNGNASELTFTANDYISFTPNISLSNVTNGLHRLYIRAKDENDQWGIASTNSVYVQNTHLNDPLPDITYMEYFLDHDPELGKGTAIDLSQGETVDISKNITLTSINEGLHRLYVRAMDSNNQWSIIDVHPFIIQMLGPEDPLPQITEAEYFFNVDPGINNGFKIQLDQGGFQDCDSTLQLSQLPLGSHQLFIRVKDEYGNWSIPSETTFILEVDPIELQAYAIENSQSFLIEEPLQAPLKVLFVASGISAYDYTWDFDNDGFIDAITFDNQANFTYYQEGEYTPQLTTYGLDGKKHQISTTIQVKHGDTLEEDITFFPLYPSDNEIASTVMKGGKAIRFYHVVNNHGEPVKNTKINYQINEIGEILLSVTNTEGVIAFETPVIDQNSSFSVKIVDKDGNSLPYKTDNLPMFSVNVQDREYSETIEMIFGVNLSKGFGGPGIQLGSFKFETIKAAIEGGRQISTSFIFDTKGDSQELFIENIFETEIGFSIFSGLFEKTWNVKKRPKVLLGGSANVKVKNAESVSYDLSDRSNFDSNQQNLIGAILLDGFIRGSYNNVLLQEMGHKLVTTFWDIDSVQSNVGHHLTLQAKVLFGADIKIKNPLGFIPGNEFQLKIAALDGEYLIKNENIEHTNGGLTRKQSAIGNLDLGEINAFISQKFGDKRKLSSPSGKIKPFIQRSYKSIQGEQSFSVKMLPNDFTEIKASQLMERDSTNGFLFTATIDEVYRQFQVYSTNNAFHQVLAYSTLLRDMTKGNDLYIKPTHYTDAFKSFLNISSGSVKLDEITKETRLFEIPLEAGLTFVIHGSAGIHLSGLVTLEFVTRSGKLFPNYGILETERYEKDQYIESNFDIFTKELTDSVNEVVSQIWELMQETKNSKTYLGSYFALSINSEEYQDNSPELIAETNSMNENTEITFSSISRSQDNRQFRAKSTASELTQVVGIIGDIFTINALSDNDRPVTQFIKPISLSLPFFNKDLQDAGYQLDDKDKLQIYRWDGTTGYYYSLGGEISENSNIITCTILSPGHYLIGIDESAPEVCDFKVINSQSIQTFSFQIIESFCAIDLDVLAFKIDETIQVENCKDYLDMKTGYFSYTLPEKLTSGEHIAFIEVGDKTGNVANYSYTFTVDNAPPTIEHSPKDTITSFAPALITTEVDDSNINKVVLMYRPKINEIPYQMIEMNQKNGTNTFEAYIPKEMISASGVRYYIKAVDLKGNIAESMLSDLNVYDMTGPDLTGNIVVEHSKSLGRIIRWNQSNFIDTAGYHLYLENNNEFSILNNITYSNWTVLNDLTNPVNITIAAYDESGNEGNKLDSIIISPCITGDIDCNGILDLDDIIASLKIISNIKTDMFIYKEANVVDYNIGMHELIFLLDQVSRN
jgi:PKD repeat protein